MSVIEADAPAVEQQLVYRVHEDRIVEARAIVEKINKRAAKLGLSQYNLVVGDLIEQPIYLRDSRGQQVMPAVVIGYDGFYDVRVEGEMPRIDGWSFVATLDYSEGDGVVISRPVPGVDVELAAHRARAAECDHCGHKRHRNATYVLRHDDGRTMQVGSSCLVPFLGIKPNALAWLADEPFGDLEDDEREPGMFYAPSRYAVDYLMLAACRVEQVHGWVSRAVADEYGKVSTSARVLAFLNPRSRHDNEAAQHVLANADDDAAAVKAGKVLNWAAAQQDPGEWAANLRALAGAEAVTQGNAGLLVSAIAGYNRAEGLRIERAARAASVYQGEVGAKLDLDGEVVHLTRMDGYSYYSGDRELVLIRTEAGLVKWWSSRVTGFEVGQHVVGQATVKAHELYRDEQQTVVTRAKLAAA